jgi:hypothetical protein
MMHGGRLAQLQETSDLISSGLMRRMAGTSNKYSHNWLDNALDGLLDNDMAPPAKAKRQHLNKVHLQSVLIIYLQCEVFRPQLSYQDFLFSQNNHLSLHRFQI